MKYRKDLVTNSSSSSFIVVFSSVLERETAFERLRANYPKYAHTIISDIESGRVTKEEALKEIKQDLESEAYWKYYWNNRKYWDRNSKFKDVNHYEDPEIQKAVKEYVKQGIAEVLKELPKRGYYSLVEYGDDDGSYYSELEHEIMPYQEFVVRRISHH